MYPEPRRTHTAVGRFPKDPTQPFLVCPSNRTSSWPAPAPTFPPAFAEGPSSYPILALLDEPSPLGRLSTPQSSGELVPHSMLSWVVQNPEGGGCKETFSHAGKEGPQLARTGRLRGFLELRRPWGFSPEARRGSHRGCIPGSPGESGLVSRGSQGLRSPLESRRGSLGAP